MDKYWCMYIVMVKLPESKVYEPYFSGGVCVAHERIDAARNAISSILLEHPDWKVYAQKIGAIS